MSAKPTEQPTPADPGRDDVPALPPIPGPARTQRPLSSYARRDVRNTIARLRGE